MEQLLDELDGLLFEAAEAKRIFNEPHDPGEIPAIATRWHKAAITLTRFLDSNGDDLIAHWAERELSLASFVR